MALTLFKPGFSYGGKIMPSQCCAGLTWPVVEGVQNFAMALLLAIRHRKYAKMVHSFISLVIQDCSLLGSWSIIVAFAQSSICCHSWRIYWALSLVIVLTISRERTMSWYHWNPTPRDSWAEGGFTNFTPLRFKCQQGKEGNIPYIPLFTKAYGSLRVKKEGNISGYFVNFITHRVRVCAENLRTSVAYCAFCNNGAQIGLRALYCDVIITPKAHCLQCIKNFVKLHWMLRVLVWRCFCNFSC